MIYLSKSAHAREHFLLAKWSSLSLSSFHNHYSIHCLAGLGLLTSDNRWVLALSHSMSGCLNTAAIEMVNIWLLLLLSIYCFDIQQPNVSSNCKDRSARVSYEKIHITVDGSSWLWVICGCLFSRYRQTLTLSSIISKPKATNFYAWKPITEQVSQSVVYR